MKKKLDSDKSSRFRPHTINSLLVTCCGLLLQTMVPAQYCLSEPVTRLLPEQIQKRIELTERLYKKSNLKYLPNWSSFASNEGDYSNGFDDGLRAAIAAENDGTDTRIRQITSRLPEESPDYRAGFFAALEVYTALGNTLLKTQLPQLFPN